mgnify:CR=1 FL=1
MPAFRAACVATDRLTKVLAALASFTVLAIFIAIQWTPNLEAPAHVSDKLVHAALYYGFAFLIWWMLPPIERLTRAGAVLGIGLIVAILMEIGQLYIPGRGADVFDVVADVAGLMAASAGIWWGATFGEVKP